MKEFIDKLIERLEEEKNESVASNVIWAYSKVIRIVNELAEEYINCSTDISTKSTDCSTKVSEMPTGWIPCSERLPEEDTMVLLTADVLGKTEIQYVFYQKNLGLFICNGKPIAWMPLPAPYTEGE